MLSKNKVLVMLLAVAAVLIVVVVVGRDRGWFGNKATSEVIFAKVQKSDITEKVSASGVIRPEVEVKISPEVSGEIIELNVKEGDSIRAGEMLVRIRPDNFISALERARANLNQQQANLADTRARLARSEAQQKRSKLDFDRQQALYEEKAISASDYELAEANFKIAQQDLESAKQNAIAAQFIVKSARASLDEAEENLRRTTIVSPMTGAISQLNVELGERVVGTSQMAGTEMLRVADLGRMEVRVAVNENDIIRIEKGDLALIDVDAYANLEKEFKGVVTQIASTANAKSSPDAVTEFEVRVRILRESYQDLLDEQKVNVPFKPGMTASVEIITEVKTNILTVPLSAVTTRSKKDTGDDNPEAEPLTLADDFIEVIFVNQDGVARRQEVTTGISDYENIELIAGPKEGTEVISGPYLSVSKLLKDGDEVKKMEEKERSGRDRTIN